MDALSKQLPQTLVFGEDTDVIHLFSCDLNTQFDFTVERGKRFIMKLFFEDFNLIRVECLACFEMQPRRRRFGEFLDTFFYSAVVNKITLL